MSEDLPSGANILVVDDTVENLNLLSNMLSEHGYVVRPVRSGRLALQAAESAPPELVLLDVMMPEMDGYEVCRRFKASPRLRDVPIVFLTSLNDLADKIKAFEVGGADYIIKPFQVNEVIARVNVHVGLRRSHQQLERSYERLRSLEALREDLVQMVVHDMRSPLAALTMLLDCLQHEVGGSVDARLRTALNDAVHSAASVNRMANDVLDVSRLEEGRLPVRREAVDLLAICRDVVRLLAPLDRTRPIEIVDAGPLEVRCDPALVARVLENLVSNAIKYSPPRGCIRISVRRDGAGAKVAVEDQGHGVPLEARRKIFEKFGAVEARKDRSFHSAGLGLAFCKLAVEAHGGTIGVEPGTPEGSIFWFTLPGAA